MSEKIMNKQQAAGMPVAREIQERVTDLLKREVILMREILANMLEEERAFIEKDPKALQNVMMRRDAPLQALMEVREERSEKLHELTSLLTPKESAKSAMNLCSLMEAKGLESFEVVLLQDQIVALIEKMSIQHSSNEHLMEQTVPVWKEMMSGVLTPDYPFLTAMPISEKRKSPILGVMNPET
ncbi:MAG: hypothetical protein P4L16_05280 [Chlamydiales bacterium]|nr:hypothetical protein [Chlamydiales bacterium]